MEITASSITLVSVFAILWLLERVQPAINAVFLLKLDLVIPTLALEATALLPQEPRALEMHALIHLNVPVEVAFPMFVWEFQEVAIASSIPNVLWDFIATEEHARRPSTSEPVAPTLDLRTHVVLEESAVPPTNASLNSPLPTTVLARHPLNAFLEAIARVMDSALP